MLSSFSNTIHITCIATQEDNGACRKHYLQYPKGPMKLLSIELGCMMSQVVKSMLQDIFFLYGLFFCFEFFCHVI